MISAYFLALWLQKHFLFHVDRNFKTISKRSSIPDSLDFQGYLMYFKIQMNPFHMMSIKWTIKSINNQTTQNTNVLLLIKYLHAEEASSKIEKMQIISNWTFSITFLRFLSTAPKIAWINRLFPNSPNSPNSLTVHQSIFFIFLNQR